MITAKRLASYFDHTQLRAYAVYADFEKLCNEARRYGFAMVAINPAPVRLCCELLKDSPVHVGAAVGIRLPLSRRRRWTPFRTARMKLTMWSI